MSILNPQEQQKLLEHVTESVSQMARQFGVAISLSACVVQDRPSAPNDPIIVAGSLLTPRDDLSLRELDTIHEGLQRNQKHILHLLMDAAENDRKS